MDIHNYKRRLEKEIENISKSEEFTPHNKKIVLDFKNDLIAFGIGAAKVSRYLTDIKKFNRMLGKAFDGATKEDIKRILAELNQTDLAEETKKGFKIMLRKLYKFI